VRASEPAGEILSEPCEPKDLFTQMVDLVGIEPTTSSMPLSFNLKYQ